MGRQSRRRAEKKHIVSNFIGSDVRKFLTAFHEAGHAVVAHHHNWKIQEIRIWRSSGSSLWEGVCRTRAPHHDPWECARQFLGGIVAEEIAITQLKDGGPKVRAFNSLTSDFVRATLCLASGQDLTEDAVVARVKEAYDQTLEIVSDKTDVLISIAGTLMKSQTITALVDD